jgi:hypothetical protein
MSQNVARRKLLDRPCRRQATRLSRRHTCESMTEQPIGVNNARFQRLIWAYIQLTVIYFVPWVIKLEVTRPGGQRTMNAEAFWDAL